MHVCGQCRKEFETEEQYLEHTCEKTGFNPTQPENLGEEFALISKAAIDRGAARKIDEAATESQKNTKALRKGAGKALKEG